jgi:hypothetical protein
MSVSPELVPVEAGADEAAADEGAAAAEAGAAADEVDDPPPLLVTADEPQADAAATASTAAAMPATRSVGRPGLRPAAEDFRQICATCTPHWVIGFSVGPGPGLGHCAMDCLSYNLRER